jgi:hypothetical protein
MRLILHHHTSSNSHPKYLMIRRREYVCRNLMCIHSYYTVDKICNSACSRQAFSPSPWSEPVQAAGRLEAHIPELVVVLLVGEGPVRQRVAVVHQRVGRRDHRVRRRAVERGHRDTLALAVHDHAMEHALVPIVTQRLNTNIYFVISDFKLKLQKLTSDRC